MRLPTTPLIALVLVTAGLGIVLAVTTPWTPLPGARIESSELDPARDFTPAEVAREVAFHRQLRPAAYAGLALSLLVIAVLGLTPLGARMVTATGRLVGSGWAARAAAGVVLLLLVPRLVTLPLAMRRELVLRDFGLSTQSWGSWTADLAKGFGVTTVVLVVAAVGVVWLARTAPGSWWLWAGLGGAALTLALSFGYPVLVEPLFNKFTPLAEGELRTSLLDLAERDGIAVDDVLVADASRRTTALNAYVSGLGSTRRIVVYDTLLAAATDDEVRLIVAHELGHVREHDVRDGTLVAALGAFAGAAALYLVSSSGPLLRRAGAETAADPRALALLMLAGTLIATISGPVQTLVSRRVEARADVHSLDLTEDPATFVTSERKLAVTNLADLDPPRLHYVLFFTHPSVTERIQLAREWARLHGQPVPDDLVAAAP